MPIVYARATLRTVEDYFDAKFRELRRIAVGASEDAIHRIFGLADDGTVGIIGGAVPLGDDFYLTVSERVMIAARRPKRVSYSYYLIQDGVGEIRGYDMHPGHGSLTHRHTGGGHDFETWPEVTLREALEDFWDVMADLRAQAFGAPPG